MKRVGSCRACLIIRVITAVLLSLLFVHGEAVADKKEVMAQAKLSLETEQCIGCHQVYTPGIVKDWLSSRHSRTLPDEAAKKPVLERRVSAATIPDRFAGHAVGCYECHSLNPDRHRDNFEHMGFKINVVVSPGDCSACHPAEVAQYSDSKKAHAYKNLMENPVYHTLVSTITGLKRVNDGKIVSEKPTDSTLHETCLACHGTRIGVEGMHEIKTQLGDIMVPKLTNWPNQGVGRENPDGSIGACTACHPRHGFLIEVARKPYTCSQCHLEPDVPAWNVYHESKHGNIYSSKGTEWDFTSVPWTVGKDFKTPTCSTCHNSLLVSPQGDVVAERTHDFGARLWVRLFGLIYSHPQPKSGNTTIIRNKDGLPLPTAFTTEPASEYLIDQQEQDRRLAGLKQVCHSCHATDWINGHFSKLDKTIKETNEMTLSATKLLIDAWEKGLEDKTNPFDEQIEQMWARQWLFYSNSIRYASAMSGAPDYAAFHNGWWYLTTNLLSMKDMIEMKALIKKK